MDVCISFSVALIHPGQRVQLRRDKAVRSVVLSAVTLQSPLSNLGDQRIAAALNGRVLLFGICELL